MVSQNFAQKYLTLQQLTLLYTQRSMRCDYLTIFKDTIMHSKAPRSSYFTNRRTIRSYSDLEVTQELIDTLLEQASHAPTTGNMQLYSVILTRDAAGKAALSPLHFNQPQVENASVVLTFCADYNRFSRWCEASDAEPCYDNLQSFTAAAIDTIAFAQQFNTLAEMAGLGVCWLGTTTYNAPQIAELLQLPELVVPLITLTVGYPADSGVEVGRLPVGGIIHQEKYHQYSDSDIEKIYSEKESRDDSKQFVAENNKKTLAQVFTDIRYPRANNEHFSDIFRNFLKESRFIR